MRQPAPGKVIGTPRPLLVPTSSGMFKVTLTLFQAPIIAKQKHGKERQKHTKRLSASGKR